MIVLAGPNGAGKSTLYATYVAPYFRGPFINADIIQRDELKNSSPEASYEAAAIATARRRKHLEAGLDFVTETVFSHPSKLALIGEAQAHGFHVRLMHIGVEAADISVARVSDRIEEGGHAVPENKVRERYERSGPLIRAAVLKADHALVYDNSSLNQPARHCLTFHSGTLVHAAPDLPQWIRTLYRAQLPISSTPG